MEIKKEFNRCDNCGSMWEKESPTSDNNDYAKFPEYDEVREMFPKVDTLLLSSIYHAIKYSGNFA
jgi:hypothetical protein